MDCETRPRPDTNGRHRPNVHATETCLRYRVPELKEAVQPPSTGTTAPVMKEAASEARKTALFMTVRAGDVERLPCDAYSYVALPADPAAGPVAAPAAAMRRSEPASQVTGP